MEDRDTTDEPKMLSGSQDWSTFLSASAEWKTIKRHAAFHRNRLKGCMFRGVCSSDRMDMFGGVFKKGPNKIL